MGRAARQPVAERFLSLPRLAPRPLSKVVQPYTSIKPGAAPSRLAGEMPKSTFVARLVLLVLLVRSVVLPPVPLGCLDVVLRGASVPSLSLGRRDVDAFGVLPPGTWGAPSFPPLDAPPPGCCRLDEPVLLLGSLDVVPRGDSLPSPLPSLD